VNHFKRSLTSCIEDQDKLLQNLLLEFEQAFVIITSVFFKFSIFYFLFKASLSTDGFPSDIDFEFLESYFELETDLETEKVTDIEFDRDSDSGSDIDHDIIRSRNVYFFGQPSKGKRCSYIGCNGRSNTDKNKKFHTR
jgi:hypothetical protein